MTDPGEPNGIDRPELLRESLGRPIPAVAGKEMPALDRHARRFIGLSPILFISTVGADGRADVSPRGDPPGFVKIVDDRTLLIPERPGNRRADTMMNIIENPCRSVGLLFLVPGVEEVLRASGRARVIDDRAALADMRVRGKAPLYGILIGLDELFFHCAKALKRSRLWNPETRIPRGDFPSLAQITKDQRDTGESLEEIESRIRDSYENRLY